MLIVLWRIAQTGVRNFLRNAWLSTAATAVMTVTLSIMLLSYVSQIALNATIRSIVNKIDVSIYIKDSTTPEQIKIMQAQLAATDNVAGVKFVSKPEALARYRQQNRNNPTLLEAISENDNPLPASFEVKVKDQKRLDPIAGFVTRDDVKPLLDPKNPTSYQGDRKATIDKIVRYSNFLKTIGLVASALFVVISTLIIFNTIRMAIFTRREEIEIMKLVGATNWFIRGPFLFEAAMYGIIAALVAVMLIYALVTAAGPGLARNIDMSQVNALFKSAPLAITLVELGFGIVIGATSSLLAMKRYLKL
jgi:cell division transport system permease protein